MKYLPIHIIMLTCLLFFFFTYEKLNAFSEQERQIKECQEVIQGGRFHISAENVSVSVNDIVSGELAALDSHYLDNPHNSEIETIIDLGDEVSVNSMKLPEIYENTKYLFHVDVGIENEDWTRIATDVTGVTNICLSSISARYVRITSNVPPSELDKNNAVVDVYGYPVSGINWIYNSQATLAQDITMERSIYHPRDSVLFSSGASGVQTHSIVDGWLLIDTGRTGNGRVYWDYHQLPEFQTNPAVGFNTVMTGTFKLTPEVHNLSIKDGNHNTSGWELSDKLGFGGFGLAIRRTGISSKAEYWHNYQGSGLRIDYPDGLTLKDNKGYKYFISLITNEHTETVVLNVWLDFGDHGWVNVLENRTWSNEGWEPGLVPDRDDKEEILRGPAHIRRYHIWTRANNAGDLRGVLPIKDVKIGFMEN